jgi:DNA-binding NarL/FixJ family response regulator
VSPASSRATRRSTTSSPACAACGDELLCSPRVAAILLRRVTSLARTRRSEPAPVALTSRQAEILELIGQGLLEQEIARQLCIELSTVKNHVHQILDRLEVHRRAEAVALMRPFVATDLDHLTANKAEKPATNGHGISSRLVVRPSFFWIYARGESAGTCAEMPAMLRDIIREIVANADDMEVVGELDDRFGIATFAENASADFVLAGLQREHRFSVGSQNPPLLVRKTLN